MRFYKKVFLVLCIFFIWPFSVFGEVQKFDLDPNYDLSSRSSIDAVSLYQDPYIKFFIEKNYFDNFDDASKGQLPDLVKSVANSYLTDIKAKTESFLEIKIPAINVLFSQIKSKTGGYVNYKDQNIINLNVDYVFQPIRIKRFLSHELGHLISLNTKENPLQKIDDVWLNEMRAEWLAKYLGYNHDDFSIYLSTLRNVSLREWRDSQANYAYINFLADFIRQRFGDDFLRKLFALPYTGIELVNQTLRSLGSSWDFPTLLLEFYKDFFIKGIMGVNDFIIAGDNLNWSSFVQLKDSASYFTQIYNSGNNKIYGKFLFNDPETSFYMAILTKNSDGMLGFQKGSINNSLNITIEKGSNAIFMPLLIERRDANDKKDFALHTINLNLNSTTTVLLENSQNSLTSQKETDKLNYFIEPRFGNVFQENIFQVAGQNLQNINLFSLNVPGKIEILEKNNNFIKIKIKNVYTIGKANLFDDFNNVIGDLIFYPNISNASFIKEIGSKNIFITKGIYKRIIPDPARKFYRNAPIYEFSKNVLDLYKDSNIVKLANDPRIFKIENNRKIWIKNETDFLSQGYNFDEVYTIGKKEFNFYK